ncbi:prolyl oligopeptidase family serine peptidase [Deinococcus maricopensis]|uniref:prolyl oligopeptidase n=1 Tax=Deinococcus maricopensis (strain DSM 21211 / LMG 22137 / NRRL B-23946 / LB-34) TaxID=709986 RepID=E8UB66_DEIML|nr:prolyl oligopeptidase family serine peptidase [Deinococcus maricopensis]ADV68305.1 Prolyl oligopeptidase [Deinococcus maricopensis DSM 21211]
MNNQELTGAAPAARRTEHVDEYHGERVPDPYRWLEDAENAEISAWVDAQNAHTEAFLSASPDREAFRERLADLWDFPKPGTPWRRGARYFRTHNDGLRNQPELQVADAPRGPWRTVLDANTLSDDGTVALMQVHVHHDGARLAYATQQGGSDWLTWRVRDVDTGEDLPDVVQWSKFSGAAWLPDGSGFLYSAYDAPASGEAYVSVNLHQKLYLHRLGTPQADDELLLARPDQPEWGFEARIMRDTGRLIVSVWKGTLRQNLLWWRDLGADGAFHELVGDFHASYDVVGMDGSTLYVLTDEDAPTGRLIAWDLSTGERRDVIAASADTLHTVAVARDALVTVSLRDARDRLVIHDRRGTPLREVHLPDLASVLEVNATADDPDVFLTLTSFISPPTPHHLRVPDGALEGLADIPLAFDPAAFEVRQDFARSRDGTRVPYFTVRRRDLTPGTPHPTLLYGYGGFNHSLLPSFSLQTVAWVERGGVYVSANLRGGSEYGRAWHQAGTRERKQNVFNDFIAVAEDLIERGVTTPARLAINGGSNGGLLVGACLTQRPDLFGAAIPMVGVLDMLRYHQFTIGWAWASDYGTSDDPDGYRTLRRYSPLHNVQPGTAYPPTLITTGDHDDRVVPAHSYKFAAALQHAQAGHAPILLRVGRQAGHGAGKPTHLKIEEQADILAFLAATVGQNHTP